MTIQILLITMIISLFANTCAAQTKTPGKNFAGLTELGFLSRARAAHSATLLTDGNVLIAGGMEIDGVLLDDAAIFVTSENKFEYLSSKLLKKRVSHSATLLPDGRVLIAGGWSVGSSPENSAEIYDPASKKFEAVGNLASNRSGHSATLLNNGKVLIAGGYDGQRNLDSAELFDPKTGAFTPVGKLTTPRNVHSAISLKNGKIMLSGGEIRRGEVTSTAELFDPQTNSFQPVRSKMHDARYKHDSIVLSDGSVLIVGGSDHRDTRGRLKSAEIFIPAKEKFERVNEMNFARFKISATSALLDNGTVLIAGGGAAAEIFDPKTRSFSKTSGAFGRTLHYSSATKLNDGRVLIIGGYEFVPSGEPTSTDQAWVFKF